MQLISAVKKHFKLNLSEIRDLAIITIIIGFIFSFNKWGTEEFNIIVGVQNLINTILIAGLGFLVHVLAQKITAIKYGYYATFKKFTLGLLIGIIVVVVSNGLLKIIIVGGMSLAAIKLQRIGHEKPVIKHAEIAVITFMGSLANIITAIILKGIANISINPALALEAMKLNIWIAIFSMIPIAMIVNPLLYILPKAPLMPALDGSTTLYASRLLYVFGAVFVLTCSGLMIYVNAILAAIIAAIIGLFMLILAIKTLEL